MAYQGTDLIPGPTASFKDPDGPDNMVQGVSAGGTNRAEVALNITTPVRPNENVESGWLFPAKPGIE